MYRSLFLFLFVLQFAKAQSPEEKVEMQIHSFFDGMREADELKMQKSLSSKVSLQTILFDEESNKNLILETDMARFLKSVTQKREGLTYDERILSYQIKIDGPMAMAWTPYRFYVNNRFLHCGVNLFTLALLQDEWKIISITDTRDKANCEIE